MCSTGWSFQSPTAPAQPIVGLSYCRRCVKVTFLCVGGHVDTHHHSVEARSDATCDIVEQHLPTLLHLDAQVLSREKGESGG